MRTKNPENVYVFTCAVTKKEVKTNPKQFFATAARAGVTDAVLKTSYISREGRRIIKDAKLTAEQVVAQYGVDATFAASLKNLAKTAPAPIEVAGETNISVEIPSEFITETAETAPESAEAHPTGVAHPTETATEVAIAA